MDEDQLNDDAKLSRRLIVIAWDPGVELQVEYEGEFAIWEARAVLERVINKLEEQEEELLWESFGTEEEEDDEGDYE